MAAENDKHAAFLVVIGASAGGIESLSEVVSRLPQDFPAAVVIGMHVSPNRVSSLGEILARRTRLPVETFVDKAKLQPGVIYVVRSNRNVKIEDGEAVLLQDHDSPQPSIDLLFRSAAEAYGENLIAVVLSGTGSDGAIGARQVKLAGGTVFVENPETAAYPGMPLSLSLSDVDVTADSDRIGELLTAFVNGEFELPSASDQAVLRSFLEELRDETGVDFTTYRQGTIQRRVQRRMMATGISSFANYIRAVRKDSDERQRLVKSFLINVTRFFRDTALFTYLREDVLPGLIREAQFRNEELRIWSAGCSTGEEAYSLAILVYELLEQAGEGVSARIFATDLDEDAVAFARRGIFPARALGELPDDTIQRYFVPIGDEYEIQKHIRSMLVFGEHDLARRAPFPRIDLILCRNVLIYFTQPLQRRALDLFAFSLRTGGYLVLGKSETVTPLGEHFELDQATLKVFRRVGSRTHLMRPDVRDVMLRPQEKSEPSRVAQPELPTRMLGTIHRSGSNTMSVDEERILYGIPCGLVVVDSSYDIQYINPEARRLLGIHTTAIDQDLVHLVQRFDPIRVRRLIDDALQSASVSRDVLITYSESGEPVQGIEIQCQFSRARDGDVGEVIVTLLDVTEREEIRRRLAGAEEAAARLLKANEEVLSSHHQLSRMIQVLREENELRQVTSAEMQAATEEVETLNEELQASNEELETLNEELQSTIEELNTTNEDLEARSRELQAAALDAEAARTRLRGILDVVGCAVIVVDPHENIVLENAEFRTVFETADALETLRGDDGATLEGEQSPLVRSARGETFSMMVWIPDASGESRRYEVSGQPSTQAGNPQLGVITLRERPDTDPAP